MYLEEIRLFYLNRIEIDVELRRHLLKMNCMTEFYTNISDCVHSIQSIIDKPLFLITSDDLLSDMIELMNSFSTNIAIFIYGNDEQSNIIRKYSNIIGYYSNITDLLKSLQIQIQSIEKQIFVYNLFDPKQSLTGESATFIWYYLLIDILKKISIKFDDISYECSVDELNKIRLFLRNYTNDECLQLYIKDDFLRQLLNRSFRTRNIELLFTFRSLIMDLSMTIIRDSIQLKNEEYLIVYRAQMMSKDDIEKLKNYLGCWLSPHGFFSTLSDRNLALAIFEQDFSFGEHVLFEIYVNLTIEIIEFSSINGSKEILFTPNSIFILDSIDYDTINQFWHVKMSASNDRRIYLNEYIQSIQKEVHMSSSIVYFIHLLWKKLGEIQQAENFCQIIIKSLPNHHPDLPNLYIELGIIKDQTKEYYLALNHYQTALDIQRKQISEDDFSIACIFNRIGMVYQHMENRDRAMESYQYALEIYKKIDPLKIKDQIDSAIQFCTEKLSLFDTHPYRTHLLILLANLHEELCPQEADQYYQQAIIILEQYQNDVIFEKSLLTMINFYWKCRMFDRALICQMKLLEFRRSTLLTHHQDIGYTLRGMARLYRAMNQLDQALKYFEQSLIIFRMNFPCDHIDVKTVEKEIFDLKDILKSISSTAQEDYNYRRISNAHKQWPMLIEIPSSISNHHRSISVLKSSTCLIL